MVLVKVWDGAQSLTCSNISTSQSWDKPWGCCGAKNNMQNLLSWHCLKALSLPNPVGTHKLCMKVENLIPVVWLRYRTTRYPGLERNRMKSHLRQLLFLNLLSSMSELSNLSFWSFKWWNLSGVTFFLKITGPLMWLRAWISKINMPSMVVAHTEHPG